MSKSLILVITAVFLLVTGTFISGTILTPYAQDIGASWVQIGILSASMYVVRLFVGTPVGRLADKKGTLEVLKYSLMLYPIIAIAYWFSSNIFSLIFTRLLHGLASAMMLPMGMAYIGQAAPKGKEGRFVAIYNSCVLLASGIGPFISTIVAGFNHHRNYRATFATLFVLAVMAFLILLLSRNGQKKPAGGYNGVDGNRNRNRNGNGNGNASSTGLIKNQRIMALSAANIALAVISSLIGFFLIPFLEEMGMELIFTGSIIAIYNIISGMIQIPLGKITDRYNKINIIVLSGVFISLALMIFPLTKNIWIIIAAMIIVSMGSAALLASTSALSVIVGREAGMGSTMGFLSTSNSVGMVFGCIALSFMPGAGYNYKALFIFSSITLIVCTILFTVLWNMKRSAVLKENNTGSFRDINQ